MSETCVQECILETRREKGNKVRIILVQSLVSLLYPYSHFKKVIARPVRNDPMHFLLISITSVSCSDCTFISTEEVVHISRTEVVKKNQERSIETDEQDKKVFHT